MILALFACHFFFFFCSFLFYAVSPSFSSNDFSLCFEVGLVAVRNLLHTFVRAENELGLGLWTAFIR